MWKPGEKVVWFGDSITQQGEYTSRAQDQTYARHADLAGKVAFVNSGISGNRTTELLARFDADVVSQNPTFVVLAVGVNDVAQGVLWHTYPSVPLEQFVSNYRQLVDSILSIGARLACLTPTVFEGDAARLNGTLDLYSQYVREIAREKGAVLVDERQAFYGFAKAAGSTAPALTKDGVHPNGLGGTLMADTILSALNG